MTESEPPVAPKVVSSKGKQAIGCGVVLVVLAVIIGVIMSIVTAANSAGGASYKATIVGLTPTDPSDLTVLIRVTNESGKPATPDCAVVLSSPGGGYTGSDGFSASSAIPAQGVAVYTLKMSVNKDGAQYITVSDSTVSC